MKQKHGQISSQILPLRVVSDCATITAYIYFRRSDYSNICDTPLIKFHANHNFVSFPAEGQTNRHAQKYNLIWRR